MTFVFTFWYFVMILLVGGIIASLVVFFKMDKKDRVLIEQFIKESSTVEENKEQTETENKAE